MQGAGEQESTGLWTLPWTGGVMVMLCCLRSWDRGEQGQGGAWEVAGPGRSIYVVCASQRTAQRMQRTLREIFDLYQVTRSGHLLLWAVAFRV